MIAKSHQSTRITIIAKVMSIIRLDAKGRKVGLLTQGGESSVIGNGLQSGERVVTRGALLLDADLTARAGDIQ